ncbi:hypothetical protein PS15p_207749 [Mucor circinelloides]
MSDYFNPSQFSNNAVTNVTPGIDSHVFYEEDANSPASISPTGNLALGYSPNVNPNTVFYAPTQQLQMYCEYYDGHAYPQPYPNQQSIVYSSSLSSEEHLYLQNGEIVPNTTSTTSSISSGSYANYPSNLYLEGPRETPFLNDTVAASRENTESIITSPGSDGSSAHLKKRASIPQSAFSHFTLTDSPSFVDNNYYDKQRSENKRAEYSSAPKYQSHNQQHYKEVEPKESQYKVKKPSRTKGKKKCSNCHATDSPSWRRSISKSSKGELVCNACGLYEKTAKRKRMLVTNEDGATKVVRKRDPRGFCCSKCGAKDSTRWRRFDDNSVHCEKCVRGRR